MPSANGSQSPASYGAVEAAVVTGAGRGIGRAIAQDLAAHGVRVVCVSRSDSSDAVVREILDAGGEAVAVSADLADHKNSRPKIASAVQEIGASRWLVVLAAATLGPSGPLEMTDLSEWDRTLSTNIVGNLAVVQQMLTPMRQANFGRIVFFGGGGAAYQYPLFPAYASSKAGLVRAVENLAEDLNGTDVAAVCIAPGAVETDMLKKVRSVGGEVRTTTDVGEPIGFIRGFCVTENGKTLSGRFVHVRDTWPQALSGEQEVGPEHWKLRRVE